MSDEKLALVKAVVEAVPVRDAYVDAVQPAARETGKAIARVASVINSALRPLKTIQLTWDGLFDKLDGWLGEKLKDTPPGEVCEPPPNVAGSVLSGLLFAQEEEALRELFVQLLATSMTSSKQTIAHPAFAEFIKQMTPTEAQLVAEFAGGGHVPFVVLRAHKPQQGRDYSWCKDPSSGSTDEEVRAFLTVPMPDGWSVERRVTYFESNTSVSEPDLIASFQNLGRLGLLQIDEDRTLENLVPYYQIVRSPRVVNICADFRREGRIPYAARGLILSTDYGRQFIAACVPARKSPV